MTITKTPTQPTPTRGNNRATQRVLHAGEGASQPVLLDIITTKYSDDIANLEVFEVAGPEGSGPPPHAHPWSECFYVLDGVVDVWVDDEHARVEQGAFVQMPQGSTHHFAIVSKTARFLTITDGRGAGKFFADLATLGACAPDAEHLPAIVEIAKRNELTSPLFD